MTEQEKTHALLSDELTGLGSRRAWEDRERIGRSLDDAASALREAKKAGVAAGERAARGARPHGLADAVLPSGFRGGPTRGAGARVAVAFEAVRRFLGRAGEPTHRFYLRALREADHTFGMDTRDSTSRMSLDWLVRDARRATSQGFTMAAPTSSRPE